MEHLRSVARPSKPHYRMVGSLIGLASFLGVSVAVAPGVSAQEPDSDASQPADAVEVVPAPDSELSADGLTATVGRADGSLTILSVASAADLDPSGETVAVSGEGYNAEHGIYVAVCVIPEKDETPTPCGGGAALEGSGGVSHWISSNPPPYGADLVIPYEPDGSFDVELSVHPELAEGVDCREVQCAITSRNDHTVVGDRSQDIFVPITFVGSTLPVASSTTTSTTTTTEMPDEDSNDVAESDEGAEKEASYDGLNPFLIVVPLAMVAAAAGAVVLSRRLKQ